MDGSSEAVELDMSFIDRVHRRSLLRRGLIDEATLTDLECRENHRARKKVVMSLKSQ